MTQRDDTGPPAELIGGPERRAIVLVAHRQAWSDEFRAHAERIRRAVPVATRVAHIGSTAIAGLDAKPIIDIQVSVPDVDDETSYVPKLEAAGYELRVREPRHRMLRTPEADVHVHVCDAGSDWERRHLLFRDWLRTDRDDRERYGRHKRELAARSWPSTNDYAVAKSPMIDEIMERARDWAAVTGWEPRG